LAEVNVVMAMTRGGHKADERYATGTGFLGLDRARTEAELERRQFGAGVERLR
jgi:hypothetical protein